MEVIDNCDMYEKTRLLFAKLKKKEQKIDSNDITHQLQLISKDIISKNESKTVAAQDMLDFMLNLSCQEIDIAVIKFLTTSVPEVKTCFTRAFGRKVNQLVKSQGKFIEAVKILENLHEQLKAVFDDIFTHHFSKDDSKKFLITIVTPCIMSVETETEVRDFMLELAFLAIQVVQVSDLTRKEYDSFLYSINDKYITAISHLRDEGYPNWHNLWIFLVRFCEKKIRDSMELTNKLLRIVEFAFRNSDHMQRVRGYECWKELINNASIDTNYICNPKQIKLLVTPLRAKFSKQEVVICKRFEVFTYLLEKLQQNSVLCLREYLEFCFGPLDEPKDASKCGQCKNIPLLKLNSAKALMELIGHFHEKGDCLVTEDVIKLKQPVVKVANFQTYYKLIIQSVTESSLLLKDANLGPQRAEVVVCMWKSLLNLIISSPEENKQLYYHYMKGVLENFIKDLNIKTYCDELLVNIMTAIVSFDKSFVYEFVQHFLPHLLQIILFTNMPAQDLEKFRLILTHCFSEITLLDKKVTMVEEMMTCFTNSNKDVNMNVGKIWICLAEELVSDLSVERIEKFKQFEEFFIWPVHYMHLLDEQTNKQILLPWMKLYRKITNEQEGKKLEILGKLECIFKGNPLLSFSVLSLLAVMAQFQTKYSKDFVGKLFEVTYLILQKPNLTQSEEHKVCSIVLQYLDASLECYTTEKFPEFVKLICNCIKAILCLHEEYKLLDSIGEFLRTIPEDVRKLFAEHLLAVISDLYTNLDKDKGSSKKLAKDLQKVLSAFGSQSEENDQKTFVAPTGRSARIAHLAKSSPKSPKKNLTSQVGLRLFGKDPETMSPLKVKGSLLNKPPTPKKKKAANVVETTIKIPTPILEENSSDFVAIDTVVKFRPENLSEHQKEVFKTRRDDIPALYEDLSQNLSNSQDLFSKFRSNSIESEKTGVNSVKISRSEDLFGSNSHFAESPDKEACDGFEKIAFNPINTNEVSPHTNGFLGENDSSPVDDKHENKNLTVEEKRKKKMEKELLKLKMDVVGADNFVSVKRRTRPKERKVKEQSKRGRKSMTGTKVDKSPNGDLRRRKSIGVVEELKDQGGGDVDAGVGKLKLPQNTFQQSPAGEETDFSRKNQQESNTLEESEQLMNVKNETNTKPVLAQKSLKQSPKETEHVSKTEYTRKQIDSTPKDVKNDIHDKPIKSSQKSSKHLSDTSEKSKERTTLESNSPMKSKRTKSVDKNPETPKSTRRRLSKTDESETRKSTSKPSVEADQKTEPENVKSKKGGKRKSNLEFNSEDIIESSQESYADVTPLLNSSKKRKTLISLEATVVQSKPSTKEDPTSDEIIEDKISRVSSNIFEDDKIDNKYAVADVSQDTSLDTTQTQDSDLSLSNSKIDKTSPSRPDDIRTQDTLTQDTLTQITQETPSQLMLETQSEVDKATVLYLDLPKKPQLTESEQMMARLDTMSICINFEEVITTKESNEHQSVQEIEESGSPVNSEKKSFAVSDTPSTNSIPSSPINSQTPSKTTELLNSTFDISPITSQNNSFSSEEASMACPVPKQLVFESDKIREIEELEKGNATNDRKENADINGQNNEEDDSFHDEMFKVGNNHERVAANENENGNAVEAGQIVDSIDYEADNIINECKNTFMEIERVTQDCLSLCSGSKITSNHSKEIANGGDENNEIVDSEQTSGSVLSKSVDSDTIKESTSIQERSSRLLHMINKNSPIPNSSKFSKRKWFNSASPSTCRIKRLMHNTQMKQVIERPEEIDEGDILTFTREIPSPLAVPRNSILKRKLAEIGETDLGSPAAKRKRVNFSDPCLTSKKIFIKEDYQPSIEAKRLFDTTLDNNTGEENFQHLFFDMLDNLVSTETDNVNNTTEPILNVDNPQILKKDKPIYPKLLDCKDDVMVIVKKVTSPLFIHTLLNTLKKKRIKTIGDLAALNETEINRLPFKVPVIANVYRALDSYYKKKDEAKDQHPTMNGVVDAEKVAVLKKDYSANDNSGDTKVDVKRQLEELLKTAVRENINMGDIAKQIAPSLDNRSLLKLFKDNIPLKDVLCQYDMKHVLEYVVENVGASNVLQQLQTTRDEKVTQEIEQFCSNRVTVKDVTKNDTIENLRQALTDLVDNTSLPRNDVIQNCLVPLLKSPTDVQAFLKSMSVEDLSGIIIEKLPDDADQFLTKLSEAYGSGAKESLIVQLFKKKLVSADDFVACFKDCLIGEDEGENSKIMTDIFKFISEKFNPETLLNLHVDFLQRISRILNSKDK